MILIEEEAVKQTKIGFLMGAVKINAPYEIVLVGKIEERLMAGYEGEHIVLELTKRQIGTCWLGTYSKDTLQSLCKINSEEEIFCVIALGIPYDGAFLNTTFRQMIGCQKRKTLEEIMMDKEVVVLNNLRHGKGIQEAIKSAIKAPSANNVQPWKVKVKENGLEIYFKVSFELDGGIFLTHLLEVLKENRILYSWEKIEQSSQKEWVHCVNIHFNHQEK